MTGMSQSFGLQWLGHQHPSPCATRASHRVTAPQIFGRRANELLISDAGALLSAFLASKRKGATRRRLVPHLREIRLVGGPATASRATIRPSPKRIKR